MDGREVVPSAACSSGSSGPGEDLPAVGTWPRRRRQEGREYPRQEGGENGSMMTGGTVLPADPFVAAVTAAGGMSGLAYQRLQGRQEAWP